MSDLFYPHIRYGVVDAFVTSDAYGSYLLTREIHRKKLEEMVVEGINSIHLSAQVLCDCFRQIKYKENNLREPRARIYLDIQTHLAKRKSLDYLYIRWVKWPPKRAGSKKNFQKMITKKSSGEHYDFQIFKSELTGARGWAMPLVTETELVARMLRLQYQKLIQLNRVQQGMRCNYMQLALLDSYRSELDNQHSRRPMSIVDAFVNGRFFVDPLNLTAEDYFRPQRPQTAAERADAIKIMEIILDSEEDTRTAGSINEITARPGSGCEALDDDDDPFSV